MNNRGGVTFGRGRGRGHDSRGGRGGAKSNGFNGKTNNFERKMRSGRGGARGNAARTDDAPRIVKSYATKDIDIHAASNISHEFTNDINNFKNKLQALHFSKLDELFKFVPPQFIQQHLPRDIASFRSYLTRFSKGSANEVIAYVKWMEWAQYELNKGQSFKNKGQEKDKSASEKLPTMPEDDIDALAEKNDEEDKKGQGERHKPGETREQLRTVADERQHMRALLQMCLRHNSDKRKEGRRALLNHLKTYIDELPGKIRSIEQLREVTHHSVPYVLSRLILGMAVDDVSAVILNTHVLHLIMSETNLHPRVLLTLVKEELHLTTRMKVMETRLQHQNSKSQVVMTEDEIDADFNPDDINDPSVGERRQKLGAGLFAVLALVASDKALTIEDLTSTFQLLSFAYIEHKSTRVLSANVLLHLLHQYGVKILDSPDSWKWVNFAFFRFPKVEYFRPEAVQLLLSFMNCPDKISLIEESNLLSAIQNDPLEPQWLEKLANALFRKEQVTTVHPMIHPIWDDLLNIIATRCATGESLKVHISNFIHAIISPYRRGNIEAPRRALLQQLVMKLGKLALQNDDEEERMEAIRVTSADAGFERMKVVRPSDPATMRSLTSEELERKAFSLVRQYAMITDDTSQAKTQRTWVLKELRSVLITPVPAGIETPYVNQAMRAVLEFGFCAKANTHDDLSQNRAIYIFADVFCYTYAGKGIRTRRPHVTFDPREVIDIYSAAEASGMTRFSTALKHKAFGDARDKITAALNPNQPYSVLFYKAKETKILLVCLYLLMSVDDPSNKESVDMATSCIPDLVRCYQTLTIETIQIFCDVLMQLVMRFAAPLHVIPLISCIRRLAIAHLYRFSRYITDKMTLDLVLTPLVDAYNTNDREIIRQMRANGASADSNEEGNENAAEGSDTDSEASELERDDKEVQEGVESENEGEGARGMEDEGSSTSDTETEKDEDEKEKSTEMDTNDDDEDEMEDNVDEEEKLEMDFKEGESEDEKNSFAADDNEEEWEKDTENEDVPTQAYLESLKRMVGDVDLGFVYPPEDAGRNKSDVLRAITVVTRVSLGLHSPIVVHSMQLLLAVLRNNVKTSDPVVFEATKSAIEMLLASQRRFFNSFLPVNDLLQILGDIQSYCRKLEKSMIAKKKGDNNAAKVNQLVYRRMRILKSLALSALHFVGFLAYKNGADEDVRIALTEYYISIFADKGFTKKYALMTIKRNMFHFRQAFAWVFVPAAIEKAHRVNAMEGSALRVNTFIACCDMINAFLPRMSGLLDDLKRSCGAAIAKFITLKTPKDIYAMKQTAIYDFSHLIKMVLEYNNRLHLDTTPIAIIVNDIIDDESIQVSKATVRKLHSIEALLGLTQRAQNIKHAVPLNVLRRQATAAARKEKTHFFRKIKAVKRKTIKSLLAHRNKENTDEERAVKRRRREELRTQDKMERQLLREERMRSMTPEQKMERRKQMLMAKQERIAKNKRRQLKVHELRKKSFEKWREEKLKEAE